MGSGLRGNDYQLLPCPYANCPWQCLYLRPEPHGQGALRLTLASSATFVPATKSGCSIASGGSGGRRERMLPLAASMSAVSSSPVNGSIWWVVKAGGGTGSAEHCGSGQ